MSSQACCTSDSCRSRNGRWLAAGALASVPLAVAGGWILYSRFGIDHQVPLPPALEADRATMYSTEAGLLNFYTAKTAGRPLLLIHSVNAAASAYEMRPIFDHYRAHRAVYALDLPGFGFSERTDRARTPEDFAQAIVELIETQIGEPVDAVALSLGGEFAARAAQQRPELFNSLALISPSGFNATGEGRATQQAVQQGRSESAYRVLANPLWGQALYDLIATRRSIEFFLKQSFVGAVPAALIDYAYATSHQPGAHYTPLRFVSGRLFTRDVRDAIYAGVTVPTLVAYDRDAFVSFEALPAFTAAHTNWQAVRIEPTLGLPQFEALPKLTDALDAFWGEVVFQP